MKYEGRLLRVSHVCDIIAVGRSSLYRMVEHGEFPSPLKLGRNSVWAEEDVEQWLREFKIRARRELRNRHEDLI